MVLKYQPASHFTMTAPDVTVFLSNRSRRTVRQKASPKSTLRKRSTSPSNLENLHPSDCQGKSKNRVGIDVDRGPLVSWAKAGESKVRMVIQQRKEHPAKT